MCNLTSDSLNRKYSLLRKFRVKKLWKCFALKFTIIILLDFISSIITSLLSFIFLDAYQEKKFDFHCLKHVNAVQSIKLMKGQGACHQLLFLNISTCIAKDIIQFTVLFSRKVVQIKPRIRIKLITMVQKLLITGCNSL